MSSAQLNPATSKPHDLLDSSAVLQTQYGLTGTNFDSQHNPWGEALRTDAQVVSTLGQNKMLYSTRPKTLSPDSVARLPIYYRVAGDIALSRDFQMSIDSSFMASSCSRVRMPEAPCLPVSHHNQVGQVFRLTRGTPVLLAKPSYRLESTDNKTLRIWNETMQLEQQFSASTSDPLLFYLAEQINVDCNTSTIPMWNLVKIAPRISTTGMIELDQVSTPLKSNLILQQTDQILLTSAFPEDCATIVSDLQWLSGASQRNTYFFYVQPSIHNEMVHLLSDDYFPSQGKYTTPIVHQFAHTKLLLPSLSATHTVFNTLEQLILLDSIKYVTLGFTQSCPISSTSDFVFIFHWQSAGSMSTVGLSSSDVSVTQKRCGWSVERTETWAVTSIPTVDRNWTICSNRRWYTLEKVFPILSVWSNQPEDCCQPEHYAVLFSCSQTVFPLTCTAIKPRALFNTTKVWGTDLTDVSLGMSMFSLSEHVPMKTMNHESAIKVERYQSFLAVWVRFERPTRLRIDPGSVCQVDMKISNVIPVALQASRTMSLDCSTYQAECESRSSFISSQLVTCSNQNANAAEKRHFWFGWLGQCTASTVTGLAMKISCFGLHFEDCAPLAGITMALVVCGWICYGKSR